MPAYREGMRHTPFSVGDHGLYVHRINTCVIIQCAKCDSIDRAANVCLGGRKGIKHNCLYLGLSTRTDSETCSNSLS